MADTLIADERKVARLAQLNEQINALNKAEPKLAEAQAIRADKPALLAAAIAKADNDVIYKQATVTEINSTLQKIRGDADKDATYSAAEKQQFVDAINNKEYK